mmetsp:Transcript_52235/g.122242  ORF Transcript_52235/g.122242 Transcript_52235/m.122242 type:complete len:227 (+) Transcript_52235:444-1124(+)
MFEPSRLCRSLWLYQRPLRLPIRPGDIEPHPTRRRGRHLQQRAAPCRAQDGISPLKRPRYGHLHGSRQLSQRQDLGSECWRRLRTRNAFLLSQRILTALRQSSLQGDWKLSDCHQHASPKTWPPHQHRRITSSVESLVGSRDPQSQTRGHAEPAATSVCWHPRHVCCQHRLGALQVRESTLPRVQPHWLAVCRLGREPLSPSLDNHSEQVGYSPPCCSQSLATYDL